MRLRCLFYPLGVLLAAFSALGNVAPEALTPVPAPTLTRGGAVQDIELREVFRDPDVTGSAVRVSVRLGSTIKKFDIALYDQQTPITVANFLAYVNSGRHNNNFFHRSVPGFIVQGGGFNWITDTNIGEVPTFPAILNEFGISNLRGTVAMAKLGNDPNSATSQWFVNLGNNAANLDAQNGGFTVFGRVIGNGMAVVDEVAALLPYNLSSILGNVFTDVPLHGVTQGSALSRANFVDTSSAVIPTLSFSAVSNDPSLVGASITGSTLRLTPSANRFGSTTVSISATDLDGASTQTTINVQVLAHGGEPGSNDPEMIVTEAQGGTPVPATGGTGLPEGSVLSAFGTPAISDFRDTASRVTITAGRKRLSGIYRENGDGAGEVVAHQNGGAGIDGATFKSFRDPVLSLDGNLAFVAKLAGVKANQDEGVWTDLFGSLAPVLREGEAIPGLDSLKLKSVTSLSMTDDALLALVKLMPVPGTVAPGSDLALVRITGTQSGVLLARTGTDFDGAKIKKLNVLQPALGSSGQGRWHGASDTVAKLTLSDKRTVLVKYGADGTATKLLQSGAGNAGLDNQIAKLGFPAFGAPGVAVLAIEAKATGVNAANDNVLLVAQDGVAFAELVRENAPADGTGGAQFAGFSDPVMNDQGDVLFLASLRGDGVTKKNKSGLWLSTPGGLMPELVARAGISATGKDGALLTDASWKSIISYALPDGESAGPVFLAQLSGQGITAQNKLGLWAVDSTGAVRLLLQTGDEITVEAGAKRVTGINLLNALPGSYGARRSYNATGSLAIQVTFSDKSQTILRIDLP